jgi:hypothetical protein
VRTYREFMQRSGFGRTSRTADAVVDVEIDDELDIDDDEDEDNLPLLEPL